MAQHIELYKAYINKNYEYFCENYMYRHEIAMSLILNDLDFIQNLRKYIELPTDYYITTLLKNKHNNKINMDILSYLLSITTIVSTHLIYYISLSYPYNEYSKLFADYAIKHKTKFEIDEKTPDYLLKYFVEIGIPISPFLCKLFWNKTLWDICANEKSFRDDLTQKKNHSAVWINNDIDHARLSWLIKDNMNLDLFVKYGLNANQICNEKYVLLEFCNNINLIKYGAIMRKDAFPYNERDYNLRNMHRTLVMYNNICKKFIRNNKHARWNNILKYWNEYCCYPYKPDDNIGHIRGLAGVLGINDYKLMNRTELCMYIGLVIVVKSEKNIRLVGIGEAKC